MNLTRTPVAPLKNYIARGLRFGSFYSPEDSNALARVAKRVAEDISPGTILDLGCGTALPTLHACGRRHYGIGLDIDESALALAQANARAIGCRNISFVQSDFLSAFGTFALIMSNPPYIPTSSANPELALEVQGDGTSTIGAIFRRYREATTNFVLHFASISNPMRVVQLGEQSGFELAYLELTLAPFGKYTSVPKRLRYLRRCREQGQAFFCDGPAPNQHSQLLMTAHFRSTLRQSRAERGEIIKHLSNLLEQFRFRGVPALAKKVFMSRHFMVRTLTRGA